MADNANGKMTDIDVKERAEQEGLGYAVMHYMDESDIQNPVTKKLWKKAREAMTALNEHLGGGL